SRHQPPPDGPAVATHRRCPDRDQPPLRRVGRHQRSGRGTDPGMDHRGHRGRRSPELSGRLSLLLTSPRLAAGLLSREAWRRLEEADTVLCRNPADAQPRAITAAGTVLASASGGPGALARGLLDRASDGAVVWV